MLWWTLSAAAAGPTLEIGVAGGAARHAARDAPLVGAHARASYGRRIRNSSLVGTLGLALGAWSVPERTRFSPVEGSGTLYELRPGVGLSWLPLDGAVRPVADVQLQLAMAATPGGFRGLRPVVPTGLAVEGGVGAAIRVGEAWSVGARVGGSTAAGFIPSLQGLLISEEVGLPNRLFQVRGGITLLREW